MKSISRSDLSALCESQETELKKSLSLRREGFESLCGLVNSDRSSGRLIFGVAPDMAIVGVEPGNLDTIQRTLAETANELRIFVARSRDKILGWTKSWASRLLLEF